MPNITVTWHTMPNSPTVTYKQLTDDDLLAKRKHMYGGNHTNRYNKHQSNGKSKTTENVKYFKTDVVIERDDDFQYTAEVKKHLKLVLERFSDFPQFYFPDNKLYLHLDETARGGSGYVTANDSNTVEQHIFLPPTMPTQRGIVAEKLTKQAAYGETGWDRAIRAYIIHELGHVYHQLLNASHFYCLGDLVTCRGGMVDRCNPFFPGPKPSNSNLNDFSYSNGLSAKFKDELSSYACQQANGGNEFVAEMFAGLLMGEEYSDDAMQQYRSFGGPDVDGVAGLMKDYTYRG